MPKHPFMVPAVVEALRGSADWGPCVQVVPGEADAFCAQDIRQNGGVVLTSDSDLLIEDLGPGGSVSFFWDVVSKTVGGEAVIAALNYSIQDLETGLQIKEYGGLSRLAFEMCSRQVGLKEALHHIVLENHIQGAVRQIAYQDFLQEHLAEEYISEDHPVVPVLSTLDPRISELVIQSLNIDVMKPRTPDKPTKGGPRGPDELSMFLPVMFEDHMKKSSWTMSEPVRQLAYAIAQHGEKQRCDNIIEYRTLKSVTGGRQLGIPSLADVEDACGQLLTTLDQIDAGLEAPHLTWLAFAIYQDIEWSTSNGKSPISAALVSEAAAHLSGAVESYSWDVIHFAAQVQASFYSLRMLKQILNVTDALSPTGDTTTQSRRQLRLRMASFPLIAEYPTVEGIFQLLSQFVEAKGLSVISNILGVPEVPITKPQLPGRLSRPKKAKRVERGALSKKQTGRAQPSRPTSANPFALLSQQADE
jgi:hypothetical protein